MLRAVVDRTSDEAVCRGHRHWMRVRALDATPRRELTVESGHILDRRWDRVDQDLVRLTRAATRLLTLDAGAARSLVRHAIELADIPPRDLHPVTGLIRAVYPLLASPPPWPLASLPFALPPELQPAFRSRDPRTAATLLFGDRSTRPVVRALSELLTESAPVDLFLISAAVAVAPLLEPDHLAAALGARGSGRVDRSALTPDERARLHEMLRGTRGRRIVELVREGVEGAAARHRLRFVTGHARAGAELDTRQTWSEMALRVALTAADDG